MSNKIIRVAVSGYFDPIHIGHLDYLELAKKLGDKLVVIVNNNHQCKLKMRFSYQLILIDPFVNLWKKLSQIFLLMVEIELLQKFQNL